MKSCECFLINNTDLFCASVQKISDVVEVLKKILHARKYSCVNNLVSSFMFSWAALYIVECLMCHSDSVLWSLLMCAIWNQSLKTSLYCVKDWLWQWHETIKTRVSGLGLHKVYCSRLHHKCSACPRTRSCRAAQRYLSARARLVAARNLSKATWTSGVKSWEHMTESTTRMQWLRICGGHRGSTAAAVSPSTGHQWVSGAVRPSAFPHLEVGRVHSQLEGVLLAEIEETTLEVIDVFHGQCDAAHHLCPVRLDWGGADRQVRPVGEVGLSLGVHGQHPEVDEKKSTRFSQLRELPHNCHIILYVITRYCSCYEQDIFPKMLLMCHTECH